MQWGLGAEEGDRFKYSTVIDERPRSTWWNLRGKEDSGQTALTRFLLQTAQNEQLSARAWWGKSRNLIRYEAQTDIRNTGFA